MGSHGIDWLFLALKKSLSGRVKPSAALSTQAACTGACEGKFRGTFFVRFFLGGINSLQNSYDSAEPCDRHQECSGISFEWSNQSGLFFTAFYLYPADSASQTWPPVAARALASKTSDPRGPGGGGYTVTEDKPEKTQEVLVSQFLLLCPVVLKLCEISLFPLVCPKYS